jgi:formylmethanofuran dehydrogenase subunit E
MTLHITESRPLTDAEAMDRIAELLREPEWDSAADFLDQIDVWTRATGRVTETWRCALCEDGFSPCDLSDYNGELHCVDCIEGLEENES